MFGWCKPKPMQKNPPVFCMNKDVHLFVKTLKPITTETIGTPPTYSFYITCSTLQNTEYPFAFLIIKYMSLELEKDVDIRSIHYITKTQTVNIHPSTCDKHTRLGDGSTVYKIEMNRFGLRSGWNTVKGTSNHIVLNVTCEGAPPVLHVAYIMVGGAT